MHAFLASEVDAKHDSIQRGDPSQVLKMVKTIHRSNNDLDSTIATDEFLQRPLASDMWIRRTEKLIV